ncbi:MAG: VWA domain-containing protein [Actinobacteria bacterium]|nr:VWA domain-containing protein [Actinomycetota bacterium]
MATIPRQDALDEYRREEGISLEEQVEFATNPEPRCACVLLLDTSASMGGRPIAALNEGLRAFAADIGTDTLASRRVEVAIVTFGQGGAQAVQGFLSAGQFVAPTLTAGGSTPMGAGINQALDMVENRKRDYRANGVAYYRPWVFLITDGEPTDPWSDAATRVAEAEEANGLAFFAVGVEGANMDVLRQISVREPMKLDGLKFTELFVWLSQSQRRVSASRVGEQAALPPPSGWASV